jgi:nucleoid DNA-binding protein
MTRKRDRKRWPVTNTDELVRHVARQFPELTRRQVAGVLNLTFHAMLQSLGDQVAEGFSEPTVKIRNFGTLFLRWYKPTRRPHINGTMRIVPPRWRIGFRPATQWGPRVKAWSVLTRNTSEEQPTEPQPENLECPKRDEEAVAPLPDVRADRW